jgi:peptidyl-prolyl cis-trans isomerase-like 4
MSVLLETSVGEIVVDLFTEDCPHTCENFLKLCKMKYYNGVLFHHVARGFLVQTGDPTGTGRGGETALARTIPDERRPHLRHTRAGVLSMASRAAEGAPPLLGSQFFITTADGLTSLDNVHVPFGRVAEGMDAVMQIDGSVVDSSGRPLRNIRLLHTVVLDDPFPDPPGFCAPDSSPLRLQGGEDMLEYDENPDAADGGAEDEAAREERVKEAEAKSRAKVLELVQDIPFAEIKPAENVLFVCKLNPVTREEDLELIFARFGKVRRVDIIRDYQTGRSLCYGFVEFERKEHTQEAYTKMDNVLIDDRRIHVDFSQSVARKGMVCVGRTSPFPPIALPL